MIKCQKCGTEYDGAERFCPKDGTRLGTGEGLPPKVPSIPPDRDPLINKVIQGRYKVLAQIGEGGMGVVYEAEHVEIEKIVALKVLRDDFSKRPEVVARFRQEARSAGKIGNAHIVDVTDFGQLENGGVYFVMEHLNGMGLNDVIRAGTLEVERAVNIVLQIARALKAAHKQGIVHRDLKPENIFLIENDEEKDFVKILDFGIAKISDRDSEGQRLTKTGMIFGTPEYMSPEQAAGKTLDLRVDIYALGCIMFEMFTGRVPFEGETFMAVLTQHMFEPPPNLEDVNPEVDVPSSVQAVVYKAMAKDKDERYGDMMELAEELERAMLETGATIRENSAMRRLADYRMSIGRRNTEPVSASNPFYRTPDPEITVLPQQTSGMKKWIFAGVMFLAAGLVAGAYILGFIPNLKGYGETAADTKDPTTLNAAAATTDSNEAVGALRKDTSTNDTQEDTDVSKDSATEKDDEDTEEAVEASLSTPTAVVVRITSDPKGAVVLIEGMGQVCSSTPCEISLNEGTPVEVEVQLGKRSETMTFTPSDQNKELKIKLPKKPSRGGKRPTKNQGTSGGSNTPAQDGELKIPEFFLKN